MIQNKQVAIPQSMPFAHSVKRPTVNSRTSFDWNSSIDQDIRDLRQSDMYKLDHSWAMPSICFNVSAIENTTSHFL